MPEDISVVRKCIIEEYLSNWFTYEELAEYLCIDVSLKDLLFYLWQIRFLFSTICP